MNGLGWYTPAEFAIQLGGGISERWVMDHINAGNIPAVRVGKKVWIAPENITELAMRGNRVDTSHLDAPKPLTSPPPRTPAPRQGSLSALPIQPFQTTGRQRAPRPSGGA